MHTNRNSLKNQKLISELKSQIIRENCPKHIGIIMDGNGRWAQQRGLSRSAGHEAGAQAIERLMDAVLTWPIQAISLYSFSKENWNRPKEEISFLWRLLVSFIKGTLKKIQQQNIKILHSGDLDELPLQAQRAIAKAMNATEKNTGLILNFCINYGGRQEIVRAFKNAVPEVFHDGHIAIDKITEQLVEKYLYTAGLPELDLLIRTSGELRLSNFLLWQAAYSEFWITEKYWPDFDEIDLLEALASFQNRGRRFGGL